MANRIDVNGDPRFYTLEFEDSDHLADLLRSVVNGGVTCVVDAEQGIIAYALGGANAQEIVDGLDLIGWQP